jgi:hypothetical protein
MELDYSTSPSWQFIASPPNWWAIYKNDKGHKIALPIVSWRLIADNRDPEDIANSPDRQCPYGEPLIMGGDGLLESCFQEGNLIPGNTHGFRYDFRDGWMFAYADFIPKMKGILRKPEGDCIYWEVL